MVVSRLLHRGGNVLPAAAVAAGRGGGGGVRGGAIFAGSAGRNRDGEDDDDDFIPVGWTEAPAELSMPGGSSGNGVQVRGEGKVVPRSFALGYRYQSVSTVEVGRFGRRIVIS